MCGNTLKWSVFFLFVPRWFYLALLSAIPYPYTHWLSIWFGSLSPLTACWRRLPLSTNRSVLRCTPLTWFRTYTSILYIISRVCSLRHSPRWAHCIARSSRSNMTKYHILSSINCGISSQGTLSYLSVPLF